MGQYKTIYQGPRLDMKTPNLNQRPEEQFSEKSQKNPPKVKLYTNPKLLALPVPAAHDKNDKKHQGQRRQFTDLQQPFSSAPLRQLATPSQMFSLGMQSSPTPQWKCRSGQYGQYSSSKHHGCTVDHQYGQYTSHLNTMGVLYTVQ